MVWGRVDKSEQQIIMLCCSVRWFNKALHFSPVSVCVCVCVREREESESCGTCDRNTSGLCFECCTKS